MTSLSTDLLAVIDAFPSYIPHSLSSHYRQVILANIDALNVIERGDDDALSTDRAVMAGKASRILFGDRAVTPEGPLYKQ